MFNSKVTFKMGLSILLATPLFSILVWNSFIKETGLGWVTAEMGHYPSSGLLFFIFLMPLFMGLPVGFFLIFKSIHQERLEIIEEVKQVKENSLMEVT